MGYGPPSSNVGARNAVFMSVGSFSFTWPVGVDTVYATGSAGGGAGGGSVASGGGGGGAAGGAVLKEPITGGVGGQVYSITIGAGAPASASDTDGTNGSDTIFDAFFTLTGGGGGLSGTNAGSGGNAPNNQGASDGGMRSGNVGGQGGENIAGGTGGRQRNGSVTQAGFMGGGGGGAGGAAATPRPGAAGGDGFLFLEW